VETGLAYGVGEGVSDGGAGVSPEVEEAGVGVPVDVETAEMPGGNDGEINVSGVAGAGPQPARKRNIQPA
jgi:hypothetical protein